MGMDSRARFERYQIEATPTLGEVRSWLDEHVRDGLIGPDEASQIEAQHMAGIDRTPWLVAVNLDFLFGQWWSDERTAADVEGWLARAARCGWLDLESESRLRARALAAIGAREAPCTD